MLKPELQQGMEAVSILLEKAQKIILIGHVNADGDVIGCLKAMHCRLARSDKEVSPILFEAVPKRYAFLNLDPYAEIYDPQDAALRKRILSSDLVLALDLSVPERLPGWPELLEAYRGDLACIDHHPESQTLLGSVNVVDPKASATGQLLYELFMLDGGDLNREEALALFTAITTDTGWFRYSNTTGETLAVVAELLRYDIDPAEIYGYIYQSKELEQIRMLGRFVSEVQSALNGQILWATIPWKTIRTFSQGELVTEDLLDTFRSVADCRCAVLLRETENGKIRVNLRSKGDLHIHKLAERFGGGGHRKAAGVTLYDLSLEEAASKIVGAIKDYMG